MGPSAAKLPTEPEGRLQAQLKRGHVVIENVTPRLECGRYRAKAVVGDEVRVEADIVRDGPHLLQAVVRYRGPGDARWQEAELAQVGNDRYAGAFVPTELGVWRYQIEAFTDRFGTWRRDLAKRVDAGQDVALELEEGARLLETCPARGDAKRRLAEAAAALRGEGPATSPEEARVTAALDDELYHLVRANPDRSGSGRSPVYELWVDRPRARFGAWYELFPRSTGRPGRHGTFATTAEALRRVAEMGFDVVYLPPIHPIGTTARKGRNNALTAGPGDVGVPWAIGSPEGGHTAVHPELGTIEDFDALVAEAERLGLEIALDLAFQCSPDHPWVSEHPEWFAHRPDGSIRYAENPPKRYQDIYPIDFDTPDKENLWRALKGVVDHWIAHGVKIFRVDNPHTKPFAFWEWLIEEVHREHPEVVFLSEAFTRPKVMQQLAKLGFSQSYTYFTWRNTKQELTDYLTELTQTEMADYFRPNFFCNTPDILHEYLQTGGPPAFKIRLVLAATLSPSYGIYSGYELFENVPLQHGSEEYLDSEKYQLRHRDYEREPNLNAYITKINAIRRKHPALNEFRNLTFHHIDKDALIAYSKRAREGDTILVIVNLNPFHWEEATVHLGLDALGVDPYQPFEVFDLITETSYTWHGPHNYVRLDPLEEPAHVFWVRG